ncbi:rho GTPase-activating protein 23 isoform X2 [Ambystoma mexicanum]|uniref:rho GTPase-activating protein 23 isoform X2 n=1 Tax=Ambystoma mexicanum TaxID=8296 RepID=UPI0037E7710C
MNGVTFCLVGIPPYSEAQATPGRTDGSSPNENSTREGPFPWIGPKSLILRKNSQGFGFTLRHFIVYPPESAVHLNQKEEEENGNGAGPHTQRGRLEPMDTIFVKNVKEGGPAHLAGLCTGDRLVKVNGESIIGKSYSQVIALIQNSEDALDLCIMPKDEDILQLAYSQDAYLKGNDPYTGGAQCIPEPPPVCYPRKTYLFQGRTSGQEPMVAETFPGQQADSRSHWSGSSGPSSPRNTSSITSPTLSTWSDLRAETVRELGSNPSSPAHRTEEIQYGMTPLRTAIPPGRAVPIPGSIHRYPNSSCQTPPTSSSLSDRYGGAVPSPKTNHNCYGAPKPFPDHQARAGFKDHRDPGAIPASAGRPSWDCLGSPKAISKLECQQALSNWMSNQVPRRSSSEDRRYGMPRYRSVSQDRLGDAPVHHAWPHSASQDTLLQSNHGSWGFRTRSDNYLAKYEHSAENLEQNTLVSPRFDRCAWPPGNFYRAGPPSGQSQAARPPPRHPGSFSSSSSRETPSHVPKHPSQPNLQTVDDSGYIGYRSYSPSFQRRTELLQAFSFREPSFSGLPTFNLSHSKGTSPAPYLDRSVPWSSSPVTDSAPVELPLGSGSDVPKDQRMAIQEQDHKSPQPVTSLETETAQMEPQHEERREEVVLRQKPPTGRKAPQPTRQMNFIFPEDLKEPADLPEPTVSSKGEKHGERLSRRVAPLAASEDSLASIPFIDEPTSPSIDVKARHIAASSVVSSAMNSAPVLMTSPTSPTFTFCINRHYSQDCSSIRASRRSSYLLAITTERSKSCDDGLNTFRDDGKLLRRLPNRVPSLRMLRSFFTDGSLDSLLTSDDVRSKRHSTSELSDVTFSEVRREGWMFYKQILTKKGKKVGGGLRQWKRVFSVLRTHLLYLYKDRREAVTAVPPQGEEEQPISIRACLVDISYSDTKRKHVFRLTTADFCEYLFQAEDRDDMLAWIKVIREDSKSEGEEPGFVSQALINKKLNDYRKISPSGTKPDSSPKGPRGLGIKQEILRQAGLSAPRPPRQDPATKEESGAPRGTWSINIMKKNKKSGPRTFGVRLEDCQPALDNKSIPLIVESCCRLVEERGLECMGIYRVPGNNAVVSSLQDQLNKGLIEVDLQDEKWHDLNVISSLLKSFFRKLPEPLFTDDKYNDFIEANRMEDPRERMKTLRKLIRDLPVHYFSTLRFLVRHLRTVADHSEKNKMEPRNLALVFGPTLVRTSEDSMTDMVTHMPDRYKIMETLIQHADWFFSEDLEKVEKTPVDEKDTQSVPNIEHLLPNIGRTAAGDVSDSTNSDSTKSKGSWGSKKDIYGKEMLSISFISAVNRKRKKRREAKRFGSSTDDDSEHEPAKSANLARSAERSEDERQRAADTQCVVLSCTDTNMEDSGGKETMKTLPVQESVRGDNPTHLAGPSRLKSDVSKADMQDVVQGVGVAGDFQQISPSEKRVAINKTTNGTCEHEQQREKRWQAPQAVVEDRIPVDTRSIVSGYSTLSTIDHSVCSEVQSVAESRGDEADDERSEFSHLETDTESGFTLPFHPKRTSPQVQENQSALELRGRDNREQPESDRSSEPKLHSRPSFNSHRLIQCDTLARKKLSRVRQEGGPPKEASQTARLHILEELQSSPSFSSQESLQHQPERLPRASLTEQIKQRLKTSADDMFGVGMRKPSSPETRRKKSAWRRHTVVVHSPLTDFNFNEWKEKEPSKDPTGQRKGQSSTSLPGPEGEGSGEANLLKPCTKSTERLQDSETCDPVGADRDLHSDWKDSGLSSLESTKTRPPPSSLSNLVTATSHLCSTVSQSSKGMEGRPAVPVKRTASSRFHQYL